MSLDVTMLDANGYPAETVGLGVNDHYEITEAALAAKLTLFSRMSDYYEEVEFTKSEVPYLFGEIETLLLHFRQNKEIIALLNQLQNLVKKAVSYGSPLIAIPD